MSHSVFAIVPITLQLWTDGDLSADCFNDLHSFERVLRNEIGFINFKPYVNNTLRFRASRQAQFKEGHELNNRGIILIHIDSRCFDELNCKTTIENETIIIEQLTAETLLKILCEVRKRVLEQ